MQDMDAKYILRRPLGMFEKNQVAKQLTKGYASVTLTAELQHPPRPTNTTATNFYKQHLKSALLPLIQKHPMLRLSLLMADKPAARFVQLLHLQLDGLVIVTDQDRFWDQETQERIITEECQHEFDLFALKPLWRLRVSCHDDAADRCSITLSVQHVIADGLSTATLWKDILIYMNNSSGDMDSVNKVDGDTVSFSFDTSDDCEVPLPIEDRNGPKDTTITASDPMPADGWQGDFPAPEGETLDTVLHLAKVGDKAWTNLLRKAKMNSVSMHAVVYAAYLLSWMSVYPNQPVKTATAINCRTYCQPPIPDDELGIFFGRYECGWPLDKLDLLVNNSTGRSAFWNLANIYHNLIQENKLLTCQRSLLMGDSLPAYPDAYCDVWYNARKNFKMGRSGGLNISDLGRFNYSSGDDDLWKLEHLWFAQSVHFYATILAVNVVTANGTMHAAITWQRGSVLENKALRFIDLFISTLEKESSK
ncbi:alcohol acetyltransferase [Absidia repens]|uniref:Alcohol acetyltransferase n=1 Tax=Absidia repens TaxID=90262 RepID=A0A1X2ISI6_9FUNG|nr:alcohol acetyltransferase [Absidia repens]